MTLTSSYQHLLSVQTRPKKPQLLEPAKKRPNKITLSEDARIGGVLIIAPSGWGKSLLLGKNVQRDAINGLPQVIIDVSGQTAQNFFNEIVQMTPAAIELLLQRVMYCNMAGENGFVPSFPMLFPQRKNERLSLTASRVPQLLSQLDENYSTASIHGISRAIPIASTIVKILAALELPLAHAHDLLRSPELWIDRIKEAPFRNPEAKLAAEDMFDLLALDKRTREERVNPFLNRLYILRNEVDRAILSSTRAPTIDWEKVASTGKTVLIDLSGERDQFSRQWKLLWIFNSLCEYIETRGRNVQPLGVVVDELSFFTRGAALNAKAISEKFRELIDIRARNNRVFLQLASQDLRQLDNNLQDAVSNLKTHLYGAILDYDTAVELGKRFIECNLHEVKYWQRVWAHETFGGVMGSPSYTNHFVIDHTPVFYTLEELFHKNSRLFNLRKGEWLLAKSTGEGHHAKTVKKIITPKLYRPPFASDNKRVIQALQSYLTRRDGENMAAVLDEIEAQRLSALPSAVVAQRNGKKKPVTAFHHQAMLQDSADGHAGRNTPDTQDTPNGSLTTPDPQFAGRRFGDVPDDLDAF